MGFFDKVVGAVKDHMAQQTASATDQWIASIKSWDEVKQAEAQGIDMKPYYDRIARQVAESEAAGGGAGDSLPSAATLAARYGIGECDLAALPNPIRLSRLDVYKSLPRDANSDFIKDCVGSVLFGKQKAYQAAANAPLVYASVVQAHHALWSPGEDETMGVALVFAIDDAHCRDLPWAKRMAKKIADMKKSDNLPDDCREFITTLRDDSSRFCFPLGKSISEGADAWCVTETIFERNIFPKSYLPTEGVVPFLLTEKPEYNVPFSFLIVPGKYYAG